MSRKLNGARAIAIYLGALALSGPAHADGLDDRLRAQLRLVTNELNELQANQASLQAQKAAAERERDAAKARLAALERSGGAGGGASAKALQAELAKQKADAEQLQQASQAAQADLQNYRDALAKASAEAQQLRAERDRAVLKASAGDQALGVCQGKNRQLVDLGREMARAYAKLGFGDALTRGEPFFQLKRVQMEKIAEGYEDRVYDQTFDARAVTPPRPPAPASAPPSAPSAPK
jgi:hypothetical protein